MNDIITLKRSPVQVFQPLLLTKESLASYDFLQFSESQGRVWIGLRVLEQPEGRVEAIGRLWGEYFRLGIKDETET